MAASEESSPPGWFARFYRVFRWVVLGGMVLVIVLILRRAPPPSVATDPGAKERLQAKLQELQRAREAGQPHTLRMQEAEMNSWLGSSLALAPGDQSRTQTADSPRVDPTIEEVRSSVRDVRIALLDDRLRAYLVFDFHGQDLSLLLEGRLSIRNGYLRFEPTAGKLGSLPLPQSVLDGAVERLFDSPQNREKFQLPPEIADIRVENSELVVSYR